MFYPMLGKAGQGKGRDSLWMGWGGLAWGGFGRVGKGRVGLGWE